MITFIIVSIVSGILFIVMDGLINANPFARKLYSVYKPIARISLNVPAGIIIDLTFGFIMAGIFLTLYNSLPGDFGFVKGVSFALLAWFFRGAMQVASQGIMFDIPFRTLLYTLGAGLCEMLVLGLLYGVTLHP